MPPSPEPYVAATGLQSFSFALLIAFLFMMFSRILEVQFNWLHLAGISYRVMGVFLVMSGAFLAAFRDRIGKCVLAFTACFLIAIPLSVWKGGSFHTLMEQWVVGFVVFVAAASLIADFRQYVRAAKTVALAILVLTIICLIFGNVQNGRLFLERGRFANPNEMAQALLLGMPFCWVLYTNARSGLGKLVTGLSLATMLYVISKTGSRGAFISIAVILAVMFVRASGVGRIKLVVSTLLMLAIIALSMPGNLRNRYETFFTAEQVEDSEPDPDLDLTGSAVESTTNRKEMLIRSLILTAQHPFFGVGPGMFIVAEDAMAKKEGKRRGAWLGTHNTFTQVSSECGIPAFLFYVAVVVLSFRKSYQVYRRTKDDPELKEISTHALALNYSLIAFIVTGMFVHAAYTTLLPILAGLTVSLVRTAEPLLAGRTAPEPVAPAYLVRAASA